MITDDWYKCYGDQWKELIPAAYAHPAKFSRSLIKRIFEHAIEDGWIEPGQTVIDPFGGVGLGGIFAARNGLQWIGIELEPKFCQLSQENYLALAKKEWCTCGREGQSYLSKLQQNIRESNISLPQKETSENRPVLFQSLSEFVSLQGEENIGESQTKANGEDSLEQGETLVGGNEIETLSTGIRGESFNGEKWTLERGEIRERSGIYSDSSEGETKTRTRSHDGTRDRTQDQEKRGGSSYQRNQIGQPNRELTVDDEIRTYEDSPSKRDSETSERDNLSNLQKTVYGGSSRETLWGEMPEDSTERVLEETGREEERKKEKYCETCGKLIVPFPVILQGDSRHLIEVIQKVDLNVSSPPFGDQNDHERPLDSTRNKNGRHNISLPYGGTPGNLGSMPLGDLELSVSSPPFLQQSGGTNVTSETGPLSDPRLIKRHSAGNAAAKGYGESEDNLGNMPIGDLDLAMSSPPYADCLSNPSNEVETTGKGGPIHPRNYGNTAGQLGSMKDNGLELAVSSPPYADSIKPQGDGIDWDKIKDGGTKRTIGRAAIGDGYGENKENLGNMKDDPEKYNLAISSPPYAETDLGGGGGILTRDEKMRKSHGMAVENENYGSDPGNLGNLKDKGVELALSSPPYSETRISGNGDEGTTGLRNEDGSYLRGSEGWEKRKELGSRYGDSEGNLGNLKDCGLSVSSPPFSEPNNQPCIGQGVRKDLESIGKNPTSRYGSSEGNLGNMDIGVSSPPFERSIPQEDKIFTMPHDTTGNIKGDYGNSEGQLGTETGNDFWSAARIIVEQVYQILKPGGHSIFVVKSYIKSGKVVDFPNQWRMLCEAVGFQTVHIHRAWLVEDKGTQYDLFGEAHTKTVERKSFFRRLLEKKGAPRIDFETVICMIKPE